MLTTARHVVDIALSHSKMVISWKFQSDWQHQHRQNAHTNTHEYVDCNLLVFFVNFLIEVVLQIAIFQEVHDLIAFQAR